MALRNNLFGSNLIDYSVNLDVTTLDGADLSGSTGSISVTGLQRDLSLPPEMLRNKALDVSPEGAQSLRGRVSVINESERGEVVSVTGETLLFQFNADVTIDPLESTLKAAVEHIGKAVGLSPSDFVFDMDTTTLVSVPGYQGNAWVFLKNMAALYKLQITVEQGHITVRSIRDSPTLHTDPAGSMSEGLSVQDQQIARQVEIKYFNHRPVLNGVVYPFEDNSDAQIFQLDAGETITTEIQLSAWLSSVNQPTVIDYVDAHTDFSNTNGVYCVAGSDGLGVRAANWTDNGGYISLKITEDPSVLEITIQAPEATALSGRQAPFSIAATSGNLYNSLRITGTGTRFNEKSITLDTGASNAVFGAAVGVTIDNPFVSTTSDAYNIGLTVAQSYAGPDYSRTSSKEPLKRNDFSDPLGERVRIKDSVFRTYSVSETPSSSDISARMDTTVDDFNSEWVGKTVAEFNNQWAGSFTVGDFSVAPLRRTE